MMIMNTVGIYEKTNYQYSIQFYDNIFIKMKRFEAPHSTA